MSQKWRYAVAGFLAGVLATALIGGGYVYTDWRSAREQAESLAADRAAAEQALAELRAAVERAYADERTAAERARAGFERTLADTRPLAAPLARGVGYLLKQQSPDGAWRSDVYATFKDGPALTPLVVCALQEAGESAEPRVVALGARAAARKGSEYLAKMVRPDGSIDAGEDGLDYPVYTAALAVRPSRTRITRTCSRPATPG
jgi:hypothetical protein